jgi:FixJ family two-component response regulator
VTEAKRRPHRFALEADGGSTADDASGLAALIDLLLEVRDRRSAEGWEVAERLTDGATQSAVAAELGITPQAVSLRARAAAIRIEQRALPVLVDLLAGLDVAASA